jgi:hypothetical protein
MGIKNAEFDADCEIVAKVAKKFLLKSYDCERIPTNDVVFHLLALYAKALGPLSFSGYNFLQLFQQICNHSESNFAFFGTHVVVFFVAKFD